jgi:lysozyme family protein
MANYTNIIPFIKAAEGGLSRNAQDQAAAYPVPDASGYHTNKGITWKVWSSIFGSTQPSIFGFYNMLDKDWGYIFKQLYWNKIYGDQINSQRIADILVNWVWMSGTYYPVKNLQYILGINQDGIFGPNTLKSLNSSNEVDTYNKLKGLQIAYINNLGAQPQYSMFLTGWNNRLKNLFAITDTATIVKTSLPFLILVGIGLFYYLNKN